MRAVAILAVLVLAPLTDAIAQQQLPRVQADQSRPWRSAFIIFADGHAFAGDVAFQGAVQTADHDFVASETPTDTLWLCSETQDALVVAPSSRILLLLFQYEPLATQDTGQYLELGRRVALVNSEQDLVFVTVCTPEQISSPIPFTTAVVARDGEDNLRTFRFEEFFFAPLRRLSETDRIVAILFRG